MGDDEADKVLESRFVIAQMLAMAGHPDVRASSRQESSGIRLI